MVENKINNSELKITIFSILGILILIIFILWGIPQYRVYSQELRGEAQLREAEWSKKIAIEEAKAKKESAILEAEAEIERAKGVAEANRIVADGLKDNTEYLQYLWIQNLNNQGQVVYVPTEANLPILEATRNLE